jgi:hypothetical protein
LENEGILYVFLVFQTEEVGQKDGGDSQTQLCGVALKKRKDSASQQPPGCWLAFSDKTLSKTMGRRFIRK